jgi:hypothetical protein
MKNHKGLIEWLIKVLVAIFGGILFTVGLFNLNNKGWAVVGILLFVLGIFAFTRPTSWNGEWKE